MMHEHRLIMIGKTGQLARALLRRAKAENLPITAYGRDDCDLSASAEVITDFMQNLPACGGIIIAAAYTDVDGAEDEPQTALQVNGRAVGIIAQFAKARSIPMIYVSTDYVFDGSRQIPITPDTAPAPINVYGKSKRAGELAVLQSGARAVILRTSWVFDGHGQNFMTKMLELAQTRSTLNVVSDQIGRPSYAGDLAGGCLTALQKLIHEPDFQGGVYHISNSGEPISWLGFAKAIFGAAPQRLPHEVSVHPISTQAFGARAKRPLYSVLNIESFEQTFNLRMPHWREGLKRALIE